MYKCVSVVVLLLPNKTLQPTNKPLACAYYYLLIDHRQHRPLGAWTHHAWLFLTVREGTVGLKHLYV